MSRTALPLLCTLRHRVYWCGNYGDHIEERSLLLRTRVLYGGDDQPRFVGHQVTSVRAI